MDNEPFEECSWCHRILSNSPYLDEGEQELYRTLHISSAKPVDRPDGRPGKVHSICAIRISDILAANEERR